MDDNNIYIPFKIEIERNTAKNYDETPFFITINGKRLKNVKRFYIDLDKDKLVPITHKDNGFEIQINSWDYGVVYEDCPYE